MCGICGIVRADRAAIPDAIAFTAMRDALLHRGPDDAGSLLEPGIALGARRLAIRDLSSHGHMPMRTPDGRYSIVYNGEVYNADELRRQLEGRGWSFRSASDTEIVLYLFAEFGPAMLERLNGMFALAVWDHHARVLFLARDRLGIKPLYYVPERGSLGFASEPKALFVSVIEPALEVDALEELLCFRYVAGERTPYRGVRRLLPGHYLVWRDGQVTVRRWWRLADHVEPTGTSISPEVWFRDTFDDSVLRHRVSDVPLGVLLSGGLDSASVAAALALQVGSSVESFTIGFDEPGYDERARARDVAARWDLVRHELVVSPADLASELRSVLWLNDEPFAHGHEPHILALSRLAKRHVTVLLSGEGSDEILGGYSRYRPLRHPAMLRIAQVLLGAAAGHLSVGRQGRKLARLLQLSDVDAAILFNACDVLPADLAALGYPVRGEFEYRRRLLDEAGQAYPRDPARRAMYLDQHTFLCSLLDRNDKMTMGASIECRVPFLDHRLVEGAARLPTSALFHRGHGKAVLRAALGDRIPEPVLGARKWGFGVPWARYLRESPELSDHVASLPTTLPSLGAPFDRRALQALVTRFFAGDPSSDTLVRQLVLTTLWYEACVERSVTAARSRPAPAVAGAGDRS